jgi:hypothetical protein
MKLSIAFALLPVISSETVLETNPQDCIDPADYDADTDFFPEKFVPHETTDLLEVSYHKTYKIITNKHHDKSYLLYQCGTEPPASETDKHHLIISVPHKGGIAVTETPQITPLEVLAKRSEITAYIGDPKLVSSPCFVHMMNDEEAGVTTIYYPEDPWNDALKANGTAEYLEKNPETIVIASPWSSADGDRDMGAAGSQEKTAVATSDWLGVYAALFNAEGVANEIIADTESRYQCSAENAASLTADLQPEDKPKILWAQHFPGTGWSIAECPTWDAAYYCEYAHHCGAEILSRPEGMGFNVSYGGPDVYWYLDDDDMLEFGKDADTWIYPSPNFEDLYNEKKDMLDKFKSVQNKHLYDTQGQGPNAWHEQRLAEYDVVALDMCAIVGTNNPEVVHARRWFRNYFSEQVGGSGVCNAPEEIEMAYVPAKAQCTPLETQQGAPSNQNGGNPATTKVVELGVTLFVGILAGLLV